MRKRGIGMLAFLLMLAGPAWPHDLRALDDAGAPELELSGPVVEVRENTLIVQPQGGRQPEVGDPVRIVVGSGVVKEVTGRGVVVELREGAEGVRMIARFSSAPPAKSQTAAPVPPLPAPGRSGEEAPPKPPEHWADLSADELYEWGAKYYRGEEVPQSYEQALVWFQRAADKGHLGALNDIGVMYELGQGVPQDFARAVSYYRQAEARNYPLAHYNLGRAYETGRGVPKDFSEALKSYRRAARLGEKNAQARLRERRLRW